MRSTIYNYLQVKVCVLEMEIIINNDSFTNIVTITEKNIKARHLQKLHYIPNRVQYNDKLITKHFK